MTRILFRTPRTAFSRECARRKTISSVRGVEIEVGTDGNDPGGIDGSVAFVIVAFDMLEVGRFPHAGRLVKLARKAPEVRVVGDAPDIALEMPVIDGIEANEGGE